MAIRDELTARAKEILPEGRLLENEAMSAHTTFRIGGPCGAMALVSSAEEVCALVRLCAGLGAEYFVLGGGSNLLVSDGGYPGLVIKTAGLKRVTAAGGRVTAGAGATLARAALAAAEAGLTGLEFAHGIPGTCAGGVFMNAGAYGGELSSVALVTRYVDARGEQAEAQGGEHGFGYRESVFKKLPGAVMVETEFALFPGDGEEIRETMRELSARRRASQPLELPSAGSVFKRPPGHYAGRLIESCGLKGLRCGGAQVSEKHGGFIVNLGGARAEDVRALIETVQKRVFSAFGVALEPEILMLGF